MRPPISDEQIETIKATYAETGNLRASARAAGCSVGSAKKYADNHDEFEQFRTEKRINIIAKIAEVQLVLLDAMQESGKLAKANFSDLGVTFGILTDKRLLLTGQATSRSETITDPATRLTPEEMEQAAKIREKHAAVGAP